MGLEECFQAFRRAHDWEGSLRGLFAYRDKSCAITPDQTRFLFDAGFPIYGEITPQAAILSASLKKKLDAPGTVFTLAQAVPPESELSIGTGGGHHVILQAEGRALWSLARGEVTRDFILGPGDVLYLPPGTNFRIAAGQRTLTLDIAFVVPEGAALVELLLLRTLGDKTAWRGVPPAGSDHAHADFIRRETAAAHEFFKGLSPDSPEVQSVWRELVADIGEIHERYAASLRSLDTAVAPQGMLKVTPYFPVQSLETAAPDGELSLTVFLGSQQIDDSGPGAELLKRALDRNEFRAGEATTWLGADYGWDEVEPYLSNLVERGLLIHAS